MLGADTTSQALSDVMRREGGRLLSALVDLLGDFQLAEDSLQDAIESALLHWRKQGLPNSAAAWLMRVARRKAIDRIRRLQNFRSKTPEIIHLLENLGEPQTDEEEQADLFRDERLKLIFTCCHPSLDRKTSVALTLRSVCGLTTEEIADAYLDSVDAMAQRLVRARHKIARAGISYAVPGPEEWPGRLQSVLAVLYLMFNEGYASSGGALLRADLCSEAIRITRLLDKLAPEQPEIEGLLALMILHHARRSARLTPDDDLATLELQDRRSWHHDEIAEGQSLVERALRRGKVGTYQIQAAIAALHCEAPSFDETDWQQIAALYLGLTQLSPNPIFELNRIVALSFAQSAEVALEAIKPLGLVLSGYQPFHAAHADLLMRAGHFGDAMGAFEVAKALSQTESERRYLEGRRQACLEHLPPCRS